MAKYGVVAVVAVASYFNSLLATWVIRICHFVLRVALVVAG